MLRHLRQLGVDGRIVGDVAPLDRLPEARADDPMVGADGIGGQQPIGLLQLKDIRELQAELRADRRGRFLADPLAGDGDPQRVPRDSGRLPEGRPRDTCLLDGLADVDLAGVLQVGPDPGLLEVSVKLVEMAGAQIFEFDVADGLIDPHEAFLVARVRLDLELLLSEVLRPDRGEVLEPDVSVLRGAGVYPLLE